MLTALEPSDLAQALDLFSRIFVAVEESPILCNGPGRTLDLSTIPLDEILRLLQVFSDWLFGQNMFTSQESSLDESRLVPNRQAE
jgi:hypothetical protein